ncbi:lytic transglycosylase domain-containing protein [Aquabacterium sp. A3]|uniref:lytic transglycosylase domain-containing protein n=1 Tax=Aquabacterium sp. A3 TaxID=3132829 RepID=UPI00311A8F47
MQWGLLSVCLAPLSLSAHAQACWDEAAQRYGVSSQLLYAVAKVESHLNPKALNLSHRQRTGSYDIGLMQINSSNLPALARFGISESDLYSPCTNIHVGAWLLAQTLARQGLSWDGVGAYNAACTQLKGTACLNARRRYAWKVYRQLPASAVQSAQATAVRPQRRSDAKLPLFILAARVSP